MKPLSLGVGCHSATVTRTDLIQGESEDRTIERPGGKEEPAKEPEKELGQVRWTEHQEGADLQEEGHLLVQGC